MSRKKPLCAWCGKPLNGSTFQAGYASIPGNPVLGWHADECYHTDPLRRGLRSADDLGDVAASRDATEEILEWIAERGPGRVVRNKSNRRSPRVSLDKIHYAGALEYRHGRNGSRMTKILGGWAACCSGEQATAIRNAGNHTYEPDEVTCGRCKIVMAKAAQSSTTTPRETKP